MRFPSPPIVSAAVSGFVVGVIVTLLATGVVGRQSHASATGTLTPVKAVATNDLYNRIRRIASRQLGPYTNQKERRLISVKLVHVGTLEALSDPTPNLGRYRSVFISFRLNDHPLGRSWRLRAAKADFFALLKALYDSDLPVYDTELVGYFPLRSGNSVRERQAAVAYESHDAAAHVPWKRWGRENESLLWNSLSFKSVDRRFA